MADLVASDILTKKQDGIKKYGVPLMAHNGRSAKVDLYQELLDAAQYMKQEIIEERDLSARRRFICVALAVSCFILGYLAQGIVVTLYIKRALS